MSDTLKLELLSQRISETLAMQRTIHMEMRLFRSYLTGMESRLVDALSNDRFGGVDRREERLLERMDRLENNIGRIADSLAAVVTALDAGPSSGR